MKKLKLCLGHGPNIGQLDDLEVGDAIECENITVSHNLPEKLYNRPTKNILGDSFYYFIKNYEKKTNRKHKILLPLRNKKRYLLIERVA